VKPMLCLLSALPLVVSAGQLNYQPTNPSFGGSYLNGSYLLQNAGAQNGHTGPQRARTTRSDLDRFTSSLESRLTSQLLADIEAGSTGSLVTDDFSINIVDNAGTLSIQIVDLNTSESTTIQVQGLVADP